MKSNIFKLIAVILFISANHKSIMAQSMANLDGNSYTVDLTKIGGKKKGFRWKRDTFKFDSGQMVTLILGEREGFESNSYSPSLVTSDSGQVIKFTYKSTNKYGSKLQIEGEANGNIIEGTAIWTNGKGNHHYTFKGILI